MHKLKIFLSFDKEEAWLTAMLHDGWLLSKAGFGYTFEPLPTAAPNGLIKIDYQNSMAASEFANYVSLFADCGWKHLCKGQFGGAHYFLKPDPHADEDIFSDGPSRASRYKKISWVWVSLFCAYFVLCITFMRNYDWSSLASPRLWFYTPGLWERGGLSFWVGILLELPFVFWREFAIFIYLIGFILIGLYLLWCYIMYKKSLR